MHKRCWHVVLQLDDGESQRGDGQDLGPVDRPIPLKFPCWCHAELVREVPPLVVVLGKEQMGEKINDR